MGIQFGSGRKDTGRSDKYSDETPAKDYKDYRQDYPNDDARRIAKEITDGKRKPEHIGVKSREVQKQELISHIQNYRETFTNQEKKAWKIKLAGLMEALET